MKPVVKSELLQASPTKDDSYGNMGRNDFVVNGELMVQITLREYRDLVKGKAEAEKDKVSSENYKLRSEKENLQKELDIVKHQLAELQKMIRGNIDKNNESEA